jgi:SM-20-related protein
MRRQELPRQHADGAPQKARRAAESARDTAKKTRNAFNAALAVAVSAGADLSATGISIQEQFASHAEVSALLECVRVRESRGEFAPARIGRQGAQRRNYDIRGDFTCWLSKPLLPPERLLLQRMNELRLQLNRAAFLGLFATELHYARYSPGAAYSRHVDQPQGSTQRKLSVVLYLNPEWQSADGGVLRIHDADDGFVDIEPIAGRLVCFLTAGREHEVLQARRERLSISGWFREREHPRA